MAWSEKNLLLTIGGVTVLVCGASGGGVYYTFGLMDEVAAQIAEKAAAIAAADQKIAQIPKIEKDVVILRENLVEYVKVLPDEGELNDFLRTLNKFERQSGILGKGFIKKNTRESRTKARFTPIEYKYQMTATLWQGLKFMNLIENFERFVKIVDFSITQVGGRTGADTIDGEVVHELSITMRTYRYNEVAKGKDVEIPNYDDRKAELRDEIWKRMQAIRIDRYEHNGMQGRRDIFVDPRESGVDGLDSGPSTAEQRAVLDKYVGALTDLNGMFDRMRADDTTLFERYSLEKRLKSEIVEVATQVSKDAGMISYRPYRLRWAQEVISPLELLQQQLDSQIAIDSEAVVDPFLPKPDIETLIAQMTEDCNNGLLEQARERYEAVRERLAVPAGDPRHELVVQAKSFHMKATTALDFKGLDLNVQGVVVNGEGRSGVLINGEAFEEGDYVAEDLLVKLVEAEQIWFVFRGLTLVRTM